MKIAPTKSASLTTIPLVCETTGITCQLIAPAINGKCLSYRHPLASFQPAKEIIEEGIAYLQKLNPDILAGLWLSIYRHYGLVAEAKTSSIEQNKMLQTANRVILVEALSVARYITHENKEYIPQFSLDWSTHKDSMGLQMALQGYTKLVRDIVNPSPIAKTITVYDSSLKLTKGEMKKNKAGKTSLSDVEKEFEIEFQAGKRKGKELIIKSVNLDSSFRAFLTTLFTGRNLIAIADSLRAKIVDKLEASSESALAEIVKASSNPYDIFAQIDDALDRASDSFSSTRKKKTIAEIIAEKKEKAAREQRIANGEQIEEEEAENEEAEPMAEEPEDYEQDSEETYIDPLEDF